MLCPNFHPIAKAALLLSFGVLVAGCQRPESEKQHTSQSNQSLHSDSHAAKVSGEMQGPGTHSSHGKHGDHAERVRRLIVKTQPPVPEAGTSTKLILQIHNADGSSITQFDILHERLVHLIVVRDGLDEFAHLHPEVNVSGTITQDFTFPKGGTYRFFADHQPKDLPQGVALGEVDVSGAKQPAPSLQPNAPGEIVVGDVKASIAIEQDEQETRVRFNLFTAAGGVIADLQPYLGAMGHLVIISADGIEYVHAHPVGDTRTAPDGIVEFQAHFPRVGVYKGWGQFQRNDSVFTVPFVMESK